jgi:transcriptional regulator with XRE-family HTH domain
LELKLILAKRVKEVRRSKGLTLAELCKLTGLQPQYLNRVESGRHEVSLRSLQRIAQGLGVMPAELISEPSDQDEGLRRLTELEAVLTVVKRAVEGIC